MCSFEGAVRAHSLPRWPPNTEVLSPSLGMPLTFTACKSMGGAAVVLRMSQSDWTVNLPVVKHTLSSYLVSLLVEFTASPKFKPRHGGSEYDGAGSCFSRAVQFSAEAWPLFCHLFSRLLLTTVNAYITLSYIFKPHASSSKHLPLPSLALRLDFSTSKDSHRPSRSSRDKI